MSRLNAIAILDEHEQWIQDCFTDAMRERKNKMDYWRQINAIALHITDIIKFENAEQYAIGLLEEAPDKQDHFEIPAFHTKNGIPHTFYLSEL